MEQLLSTRTLKRQTKASKIFQLWLTNQSAPVSNKVIRTLCRSLLVTLLCFTLEVEILPSASLQAKSTDVLSEPETQFKTALPLNQESILNYQLFVQGNHLVLRWQDGAHAIFSKISADGPIEAEPIHEYANLAAGMISAKEQGSRRVWTYNTSLSIEFQGSFPVKLLYTPPHSASKYVLELRYEKNRTDRQSREPRFSAVEILGNAMAIQNVQLILETIKTNVCITQQEQEQEQESESESESEPVTDQCTNPTTEPPVGFDQPTEHHVIRIDQRPGDCLSYFTSYPPIERGHAIEEAMALHPPYRGSESGGPFFPVADYWSGGRVYVLVSHDLTANSFTASENAQGLYETLIADAEKVATRLLNPLSNGQALPESTQNNHPMVMTKDAELLYLDVVVQFGVMSPAQALSFQRAAEYILDQYGITLRRIEIP